MDGHANGSLDKGAAGWLVARAPVAGTSGPTLTLADSWFDATSWFGG